jgi:hypothetical protein
MLYRFADYAAVASMLAPVIAVWLKLAGLI